MERGLTFLEFNYMIMQSYDFYKLFQDYGCNMQFGGDDQWANMLGGTELIRRKLGKDAYAMTITLLLNSEGKKMGKTEKGAVWLDPEKTTPYEFYQYWRNVSDQDVIKCLKLLTFVPIEQIEEMERTLEGQQLNQAKELLAHELTELVHGKDAADKAQEAAKAMFGGSGNNGGYHEFHFEGNADDMFGDFFDQMFHGKSRGFGSERYTRSGSSRHPFEDAFSGRGTAEDLDLHAEVSIRLEEAASGCEKQITLRNPDGTTNTLLVKIPAGIENGKSIRLRGKGHTGSNGRRGDLLLKVNVEEKKGFERRGMDIYTTIQIPYTTAVFGGEARVSTLYGDVVCKIKEGTQSGSKLRLRGKGMVSMKDANVHGDHYATIEIAVPRSLNRTARQKLMEYKEAC